jgi:hypothetical protein
MELTKGYARQHGATEAVVPSAYPWNPKFSSPSGFFARFGLLAAMGLACLESVGEKRTRSFDLRRDPVHS